MNSQPHLFTYCLNTSTIRGANLSLDQELQIAADAGFDAIEPWIVEIERYQSSGASLADLRKRIEDLGLQVAGAIGFAEWIIDDNRKRQAALDRMKRDMDLVLQIGGRRIAAPPIGAQLPEHVKPDLDRIAERYRALLELGMNTGVTPMLELWGFSKTLSRLSEVFYVATEAGHPAACMLLDSYHLYKGGSDLASLRLLSGAALPVFHINDYPDTPPRTEINDSARVYPGDGVAPLNYLFRTLSALGFSGALSVELFNPEYWKQPAAEVARRSLEKTKAAVSQSLSGL